LPIPGEASYHTRSVCINLLYPLAVIRHVPLTFWETANHAFESAKELYYRKKGDGDYIADQTVADQTGHGYEIWPTIDSGLRRIEQLLEELAVAMKEEEWVAAQIPH